MGSRKGRSRTTADRMARYKVDAKAARERETQKAETRNSPRSKNRRPSSTGNRSAGSGARSTGKDQQLRDQGRQSGESEGCFHSPSIAPSGVVRGEEEGCKSAEQGAKVSALEMLTEIPETPPRIPQAVGQKKVHVPVLARGVLQKASDADRRMMFDSQIPSKKRKEFHTPPRANGSTAAEFEYCRSRQGGTPNSHSRVTCPVDGSGDSDNLLDIMEDPPTASTKQGGVHVPWFRGTHRRGGSVDRSNFDMEIEGRQDLDVIKTSSSTISILLEGLRKKIMREMEEMHKEQLAELRKVSDSMVSVVASEVRNLQAVLQMMSAGSRSTGNGGKTSLSEWEKKLNELTPNVRLVFCTEVLARIVCYNAPLTTVAAYGRSGSSDLCRASEAVQTLLFSLQPGEKKGLYAAGIGKMHRDFKFNVVQNAFYNVSKDSFGLFKPCAKNVEIGGIPRSRVGFLRTVDEDGGGSFSTEGVCRIEQPKWLKYGFVTVEKISEARKFLETANQSRKGKIRDSPTASDIATHGAIRVYCELGSHLHQARENVRSSFFQGLGYLLVHWNKHIKDTEQSTMEIRFPDGLEEGSFLLNLEEIPYAKNCSSSADTQTMTSVDAANKATLNRLLANWEGMVMQVQHEVYVVSGSGGQRKHSGGEKKTIHRLINVIDVACDVCVEYCRVRSREVFLRTHPSSLRCVMVFALLFKAMVVKFLNQYDETTRNFPDPEGVKVHVTRLKDIIPGPNSQKGLLASRCLRMTQKEFEILHRPPVHDGSDNEVAMDVGEIFAYGDTRERCLRYSFNLTGKYFPY